MKRSNLSNFIILTLSITIVILVAIGSYYKIALKERIYKDALIVNQLGKIRGDIQRFTKLKIINNSKYIKTQKEIDAIFNSLSSMFEKENIIPSSCKKEFISKFYSLKNLWKNIKNSNNIIALSETAWIKSNTVINDYEKIHKLKFNSLLKSMDIFIYVSIIFLSIITFIVYFKIKKGLEIDIINDKLTGLYNRLFFDKQYSYLTNRSMKENSPLSMIIIDIDNFKKINDTYGHKKGDLILQKVGEVLKRSIRKNDLAFRYGGEEFVILLPDTHLKEAHIIADRIRNIIPQKIKINNNPITISGGVGEYKGEDARDFFKKIDKALYEAKKSGKNKVVSI